MWHMPEVKCSVNSCVYWGEGNVCTAEAIMVKNSLPHDTDDDLFLGKDMEIGAMEDDIRKRQENMGKTEQMQNNEKTQATHSSETCCETFKMKSDI